jgi:8-oxo-dGTP pyrophosphatase MutT (NUDIX family)
VTGEVDRIARWLAARAPREEGDPACARAAVAIILAQDPGAMLLIRRAARAGDPWSGQMGLPGGREGQGDRDLLETAIRETREEVGIELGGVERLGVLDDLKPVTPVLPPVIVRPYVFRLPLAVDPVLNGEVAGAWWVGLDRLVGPGVHAEYEVEALGLRMKRPGYRLEHGVVWGMTERILAPLVEMVRGGGEG